MTSFNGKKFKPSTVLKIIDGSIFNEKQEETANNIFNYKIKTDENIKKKLKKLNHTRYGG